MTGRKYYLGLDIGTSSVKGVFRSRDGHEIHAKQPCSEGAPRAWIDAIRSVIRDFNSAACGEIAAVAISSQVGTYIVNGNTCIPWKASVGKEELDHVKSVISEEAFVRGIGMPHPDLISYPLPRLLYIQKHYGVEAEALMPKEWILRDMTGRTLTDVFSMRGIANAEGAIYAEEIIKKLDLKLSLPELRRPTDLAGFITPRAAAVYGLRRGTPVYLGCNDFFAGLLGMGIYDCGDFFDLSGTSEHIGYISEGVNRSGFVSGAYFNGHCTYGGTKASGIACDLAIRNFCIEEIDLERVLTRQPPVFLPYLCGERAPIFDEEARGVYFGLHDRTDRESLAYATLEGVVYSLYDIVSSMKAPTPARIICGGGSSQDPLMNLLRATLFDCDIVSVREHETSALGACMLAMVGDGAYPDIPSAIRACVEYLPSVHPRPAYKCILRERFSLFKRLYGDLKETFKAFNEIRYEKE